MSNAQTSAATIAYRVTHADLTKLLPETRQEVQDAIKLAGVTTCDKFVNNLCADLAGNNMSSSARVFFEKRGVRAEDFNPNL